jgi:hypothetical protein
MTTAASPPPDAQPEGCASVQPHVRQLSHWPPADPPRKRVLRRRRGRTPPTQRPEPRSAPPTCLAWVGLSSTGGVAPSMR